MGFAVKVLGPDGRGLPTADLRKVASGPSLGVSLQRAHVALEWVADAGLRMWRLPNLVPYGTHPDYPQFHGQVERYADDLAAFGEALRAADVRVSEHPGQYTLLSSPRREVNERSVADLVQSDQVFSAMGFTTAQAPLILHAGGRYGDPAAARERLIAGLAALPGSVRSRLCLENDDRLWSAVEVAEICNEVGVRMVWDLHHQRCHNPEEISLADGLALALDTWPANQTPKMHLSSGRGGPLDRPHADDVTTDDWNLCVALVDAAGRDVDVMLEVKDKDHAVLDLADRIRRGEARLSRFQRLDVLPMWPASALG